jgi:hypothetical protein
MASICRVLFLFLALAIGSATFAAETATSARGTNAPTFVDHSKRYLAFRTAALLEDRSFTAILRRHLSLEQRQAQLGAILDDYRIVGAAAASSTDGLSQVDRQLRQHKGIEALAQDLLELRLYVPKNYVGRIEWSALFVAYVPAGKSKNWRVVEAFDRHGAVQRLDARVPPSTPLLIAGINRRTDRRAGIALVNQHLRAVGLQESAPMVSATATGFVDTTKLTEIALKYDEEPWISGDAEIYAVVSGVQPNQAKATLTIVDLPYLDEDGMSYSPNQIVIFWNQYRYSAANLQLFEHDDNTNYKDLALALSQGVTAILGAFAPTYAVIGQVATAILQAMPASWFTNDDEYVDTFYTLEKGRAYVDYVGAAKNATISLAPYRLQEQ